MNYNYPNNYISYSRSDSFDRINIHFCVNKESYKNVGKEHVLHLTPLLLLYQVIRISNTFCIISFFLLNKTSEFPLQYLHSKTVTFSTNTLCIRSHFYANHLQSYKFYVHVTLDFGLPS